MFLGNPQDIISFNIIMLDYSFLIVLIILFFLLVGQLSMVLLVPFCSSFCVHFFSLFFFVYSKLY